MATTTISAMYKRQVNLSSRCDTPAVDSFHEEDCVMSRLIDYCAVDAPTGTEGVNSAIPKGNIRHISHFDQSFDTDCVL